MKSNEKLLNARNVAMAGMFSALIVVGAFLKIDIPLPLYTMHFTLQWLFVMMAALLLGSKMGTWSVVVYLCMGLVGLPVFAAGGGIAYVLRPGFGFLLGFVFAAYVMGLICEKIGKNSFLSMLAATSVGLIIYYSVGAVYFYLIKNIYVKDAVSFGVVVVDYCLITVVPDFILCVLASGLCRKIKPALESQH